MDVEEPSGSGFRELTSSSEDGASDQDLPPDPEPGPGPGDAPGLGEAQEAA